MNTFVNYIIEANIGLLIFLACYWLFLQRETNFRLLRIFMLTGIFASLLFPLIHFEGSSNASPLSIGEVIPAYWMPEVVAGGDIVGEVQDTPFHFWTYAALLYAIGFIIFFLAIAFQMSQLLNVISRSRTYRLHKLRIAESKEDKPTFSFFNFIFIGKAHVLSSDEKQQIILHESVHARQWHSFDILLINALRILFWFNPLINTYKKIFVHLHEFEADARTVEHSDVDKYCSLLARVALESADFKFANHFNSSLIVKRITMIRSSKNKISRWKVAVFALLLPATFLLVSCQDQLGKVEGISAEIISEIAPARPQGGLDAFYDVIKKSITYPAESRAGHKYGSVLVGFVVNENGSLSDMEVLVSPDELLGKEALRMLALSPEWIPATKDGVPIKQQMILPIEFKLDFPGKVTVVTPKRENTSSVHAERASVRKALMESSLEQIVVVGYAN